MTFAGAPAGLLALTSWGDDGDPFVDGLSTSSGGIDWMMAPFLIVPALFVLGGLALIASAFADRARMSSLLRQQPVMGRVVSSRLMHSRSGQGAVSTRVVETIEYRTPTGQVIRATPMGSATSEVDRSGMEVPVYADPTRPERIVAPLGARGDTGMGLKLVLGGTLAAVGLAFLAFAWQFAQGWADSGF